MNNEIIEFKKEKSLIDYEELIGDIFYWQKWMYDIIDTEEKVNKLINEYEFIGLQYFSELTFEVLKKLNIEYPPFETYKCPYSGIKFLGVLPLYLFSKDISKYRDYFHEENMIAIMTFDQDYNKKKLKEYDSKIEALDVDDIGKAMQGHGYTECTLPTDGYGEWKLFLVKLSNDDLLLVRNYVWYNK